MMSCSTQCRQLLTGQYRKLLMKKQVTPSPKCAEPLNSIAEACTVAMYIMTTHQIVKRCSTQREEQPQNSSENCSLKCIELLAPVQRDAYCHSKKSSSQHVDWRQPSPVSLFCHHQSLSGYSVGIVVQRDRDNSSLRWGEKVTRCHRENHSPA